MVDNNGCLHDFPLMPAQPGGLLKSRKASYRRREGKGGESCLFEIELVPRIGVWRTKHWIVSPFITLLIGGKAHFPNEEEEILSEKISCYASGGRYDRGVCFFRDGC